jgi:hypothetical protein
MIWVGPVLFGLIVVSLIGICVWSLVLAPAAARFREARGLSTRTGFDIPGDDIIGTRAEPLGWTALDELQLHRLLNGPTG